MFLRKRRGSALFVYIQIISDVFHDFEGKCPPNCPYCFLFPVSVNCQGFSLDYAPRKPPVRQLPAHLNIVNRGAPKMVHDSSALTATCSRRAQVKMSKWSSLTKFHVLTDILKLIVWMLVAINTSNKWTIQISTSFLAPAKLLPLPLYNQEEKYNTEHEYKVPIAKHHTE